jgi:nucleotide-binding universal stress UspA family protein
MARKIMVGYRRDRHGEDALALGRVLARFAQVDEVVVAEAGGAADRSLATTTQGWPEGVRVTTRAIPGSSAAGALTSVADAERADVVVLGSTHRGRAGRVLIGTTAGSMFRDAKWAVTIAPPGFADSPAALRRIGVAFDGSDEALVALEWAAALASESSADLRLAAVAEPPPPPVDTWGASLPAEAWVGAPAMLEDAEVVELQRDRLRRQASAASASVGRADADTLILVGDPVRELQEAASDFDMLVLGSHGRGPLAGALEGSVSRRLAHSCPVPLAVVPSRA